jgi:molybdopterin molybdotransferase
MLTYEEARRTVISEVSARLGPRPSERIAIDEALGRILAQEIRSDRAYPPFDRSTRDGYAVRAAEAAPGVTLRSVGEIKAGDEVRSSLAPDTCVQIMTGAAVPPGGDAVVMIEFTERSGDQVGFTRQTRPGQNIVPRGSEAAANQSLLSHGTRLGYAELAIAAQVGATELVCYPRPRVAILSTGDEVVAIDRTPGPFQIRNSNGVSLAAQARLSGAEPILLGNAPDLTEALQAKISEGLAADILVLSGGVSMGKYDLVEAVLKALGAEFYFDAVAIRPGKPAVFGRCGETFVFGLPGNPVSTMVTFELFVTAAIDLFSGAPARDLPFLDACLAEPLNEKPGLTHFLPARLGWKGSEPWVRALNWQGSGDIAALAQANCFLVVPADRDHIASGDHVNILPRRDVL